jgi:hypothetical protein
MFLDYYQMIKEVGKCYAQEPNADWKIFVKGEPSIENTEIMISNGKDTYYAKTFPYSPFRISGKAIKIENVPIEEKVPYQSGLRRLSRGILRSLMENGGLKSEEIEEILKAKPIKPKKAKKSPSLLGPIYRVENGITSLASISENQKKLVEKLDNEVEKLQRSHLNYIG